MDNERRLEFEDIKRLIKENIKQADCGLFDCRNIAGDEMENIYEGKYYTLDICYDYSYFEVFGTNDEEFDELSKFYSNLGGM